MLQLQIVLTVKRELQLMAHLAVLQYIPKLLVKECIYPVKPPALLLLISRRKVKKRINSKSRLLSVKNVLVIFRRIVIKFRALTQIRFLILALMFIIVIVEYFFLFLILFCLSYGFNYFLDRAIQLTFLFYLRL